MKTDRPPCPPAAEPYQFTEADRRAILDHLKSEMASGNLRYVSKRAQAPPGGRRSRTGRPPPESLTGGRAGRPGRGITKPTFD
jgi:hypothetical protein